MTPSGTIKLIIIAILLPELFVSSTIKTKAGITLDGELEGLVFVKAVPREGWNDNYYMLRPECIVGIDEEGIHLTAPCSAWPLDCSARKQVPYSEALQPTINLFIDTLFTDEDVVKYVQDNSKLDEDGEIESTSFSEGDFPLGCHGRNQYIYAHQIPDIKILGRFVSKEGKLHLLPSLKITSQKGSLEIPVTDIVGAQNVPKLASAIQAKCKELKIPYPITNQQLSNEVTRAFVERAIEEALSAYTKLNVSVGLKKDRIVVRVVRSNLTFSSQNPETIQAMIAAQRDEAAAIQELPRLLESALSEALPPHLGVEVETVESSEGKTNPLVALAGGESKDLLTGQSERIDFPKTWNLIIKAVRDSGFSVDRELPIERGTGKRTLRTVVVPSQDNQWLYQSYQEVSLWDPHFRESMNSRGTEYRISVTLVVGRRKQLNPAFEYFSRSGPGQDELLDSILRAISKPRER